MIWALLISTAFAGESWFCSSQSSKVDGPKVSACGVGIARDEAGARAKALENAKEEFDFLCRTSSNCENHEVSVSPGRTTCEMDQGVVKCNRLVIFMVGEKISAEKIAARPKMVVIKGTPQGTATGPNDNYTSTDFWRDWSNKYMRPN